MQIVGKMIPVLAALAGLGIGAASAETLRLGDFQSTTHIVSVEGTTHWMKQVEAATGGKITFEHFPSEQAAKASALLDAVHNGILDAALIGPSYHADALPMNSVIDLPGFYGSAVQGTAALQQMLAEGPLREELLEAGVVPIFGFVLPPYQILSTKSLDNKADLTGLDVRTSGSTQAMTARALGGNGISLPGPEVYTAVETGRLDAILFPLASVPAYNLQEVVTHISRNGSFGGYSFIMVLRRDLFEGLPQDVQTAMLEAGKETASHIAKAQDDAISAMVADWTAKGVEVYDFSAEDLAKQQAAMQQVTDDWVKRIGRDSDTAKAVLATYSQLSGK